jgi:hypothetical protein
VIFLSFKLWIKPKRAAIIFGTLFPLAFSMPRRRPESDYEVLAIFGHVIDNLFEKFSQVLAIELLPVYRQARMSQETLFHICMT